ncbi:AI-2E family transporter [Phenylobacterium sp. LH3H17]|uniref:AI-2E family transporter n=1 Tax=Phenylobacterium sp. LH3H17 TaxID=2903901 RepID=UPI0020C9BC44|nr:AI-2E family transporter [Phenylobacterium sp. LH3H17]UTP41125.1 AI-2E family transporter [Phenylobacterium sp. LH3H17]
MTRGDPAAPEPSGEARPLSLAAFAQRLALTAAAVVGVALVVRLADVLLLVFGAILVAVLLHAVASPLRDRTPLGRTELGRMASLVIAVVVCGALIAATIWAFGRQIEMQLANLADLLPRAWTELEARLARSTLGDLLLVEVGRLTGPDGGWLSLAPKFAANAATAMAATLIVVFAGLYLAFHPRAYAQGFVRLFPRPARARTTEVLEATNDALKRWLIGQLLSMVLVGATTTLGLWLVGVPSPIGLGVLAGVSQFVPVVGPMAAAVPGLLIALTAGPQTFALAGAVYLAAAQIEANLVTPLMLRRMAELPMAVTLFAVLGMGMLLGPLGVLFATPLAVVAYVIVRKVYVEGVLGDPPEPMARARREGRPA